MRIAHVIDSMEMGGAEVLVTQLCRRQRAMGHQSSVDCLFALGVLGELLRKEDFTVNLHGPASGLSLMRKLYQRFRNDRIEAVHCHNAAPAVLGALPARAAGARAIVLTRHGLVSPPYSWRREIKVSATARLAGITTAAVCDAARRNLAGAPGANPRRMITVYNGIEEPARSNGASLPPKRGFTILHVGRLNPAKDQATLLRALAMAAPQLPDARLWIAGGGALEPSLRALCRELDLENRVEFLGERLDVGNLLDQADLFALSSVTEGLPVSLLEAMSASLPVVVTRVGGMPEVVEPANAGQVVSPSDPAQLAQAFIGLAQQPERLREMGLAGRRHFERHFTAERMCRAYLNLYEKPLT